MVKRNKKPVKKTAPKGEEARAILLPRKSKPLYLRPKGQGKMGAMEFLIKATPPELKDKASRQQAGLGQKPHPFKFEATTSFKNFNSHHSACINTKTSSLVGLGFTKDQVEEKLNPLCMVSWQDVMGDIGEDYEQVGNGYIEVVRREPKANAPITGLHHVKASCVWLHIEDSRYTHHYEVVHKGQDASALWGGKRKFAAFGDIEGFMRRHPDVKKDEVSEIIHFRNPTSLSRWYGMPNWLAAVAAIELKQCLYQQKYDFFLNRGVPEFILFLLGGDAGDENMDTLENLLQSHIGLGQSHKSAIINIKNTDVNVVMERLGLDAATGDDAFSSMSETLGLDIVTAHQVPPLLAGIQIPGKLGATNEMVNAMMAFQTLLIGPQQKNISTILKSTLGNPLYNAGVELSPDVFKFKTILDEIDVQKADTIGRAREEAAGSDRDFSQGVKD